MTVTREDDKPWKTDLARKAAQRREMVGQELEEVIKKAASFEEALHLAVEMMKKRFARFSAVTAYVADGEGLAVHTALERPQGPDRVGSVGGPLASTRPRAPGPDGRSRISPRPRTGPRWAWRPAARWWRRCGPRRACGPSSRSGATSATPSPRPTSKLLGKVAQALAKKTPAA